MSGYPQLGTPGLSTPSLGIPVWVPLVWITLVWVASSLGFSLSTDLLTCSIVCKALREIRLQLVFTPTRSPVNYSLLKARLSKLSSRSKMWVKGWMIDNRVSFTWHFITKRRDEIDKFQILIKMLFDSKDIIQNCGSVL